MQIAVGQSSSSSQDVRRVVCVCYGRQTIGRRYYTFAAALGLGSPRIGCVFGLVRAMAIGRSVCLSVYNYDGTAATATAVTIAATATATWRQENGTEAAATAESRKPITTWRKLVSNSIAGP